MLQLDDSFRNPSQDLVMVPIYLNKMPKNCEECPLYQANKDVDDECTGWGDGEFHRCIFSSVKRSTIFDEHRPTNCPLIYIKNFNGTR